MLLRKFRLLALALAILSCKKKVEKPNPYANYEWYSITVKSSAYNSLSSQTDGNPHITAFGDSLYPGLRYIAVSQDLQRMGLKHNTPVKIEGFDSIYIVKDKMHPRWRNHIDIYMGLNVDAAREWGRRKVCIDYGIPKTEE